MRTKGALGKNPRKDKVINLRVGGDKLDQLREYANNMGISLTDLLLDGARYYYNRQYQLEQEMLLHDLEE